MLVILSTHPIQYQVPLWQLLAQDGRVPFEVWYLSDHGARQSRDNEFDRTFAWDIDLLTGYPFRFLDGAKGASPGTFWSSRLREKLGGRLRHVGAKALWIQGWQVAAYWQAVREAKAAGAEVWLRGDSNDLRPAVSRWKHSTKRVLLQTLFKQVDRFLYVGSANRRLYENFGIPPSQLYQAPHAVDNQRFASQATPLRPQRSELRSAWGIPGNAFCVLFCGKFIAKKRPMDLVHAARLLRSDGRLPNIHLLFVGSGILGGDLRNVCNVVYDAEREYQRPTRSVVGPEPTTLPASFAGFLNQTEISRAYVAADCLVLPSDHGETWGLVVNEALASQLVCVTSDACGCSEDIVANIDPKLCFHCGDIAELAEAILHAQHRTTKTERLFDPLACHSLSVTIDTVVALSQGQLASSNGLHDAASPLSKNRADPLKARSLPPGGRGFRQ